MIFRAMLASAFLALTGCGWMGESVIDQVAGMPASSVISDIKTTSDEYAQEKHEERVDELSDEYEEFLRTREAAGVAKEPETRSVVIDQKREIGDDSKE